MGEGARIRRGTVEYRQANLALFIAGFVTFSTLYDFQPLLPLISRQFGVSPALGSLPLSVATFALAVTLPVAGSVSDALGRRLLLVTAVLTTSLMALATAGVDSMFTLLGLRLLQGTTLAGVPAVAMAYLGEELEPTAVGGAMGLYIAGNALGGMSGRILTAWLAAAMPWTVAVATIGATCLALSLLFLYLLPPSRNFRRRPFRIAPLTASLLEQLREPGLLCLYAIAFTSMGGFVTLYNYITFRLLGPPYHLSQAQVGWIFLSYLFGAFGSSTTGFLVDRCGRGRVMAGTLAVMAGGLLLTLLAPLPAVVVGTAMFTVGFFGTHAVASAWVGVRAATARAQAAGLYLFAYYLGSSISGTAGGWLWSSLGWSGVVALILMLLTAAAYAARRLSVLRSAPAASPHHEAPATPKQTPV